MRTATANPIKSAKRNFSGIANPTRRRKPEPQCFSFRDGSETLSALQSRYPAGSIEARKNGRRSRKPAATIIRKLCVLESCKRSKPGRIILMLPDQLLSFLKRKAYPLYFNSSFGSDRRYYLSVFRVYPAALQILAIL